MRRRLGFEELTVGSESRKLRRRGRQLAESKRDEAIFDVTPSKKANPTIRGIRCGCRDGQVGLR